MRAFLAALDRAPSIERSPDVSTDRRLLVRVAEYWMRQGAELFVGWLLSLHPSTVLARLLAIARGPRARLAARAVRILAWLEFDVREQFAAAVEADAVRTLDASRGELETLRHSARRARAWREGQARAHVRGRGGARRTNRPASDGGEA